MCSPVRASWGMMTTSANFFNNRYTNVPTTFSGADIVCTITVPLLINNPSATINGGPSYQTAMTPVTIGTLQTLTVSTHRDKFPVRSLHSLNPRGFTRGPRTIAGSLIFAMFDRESLRQVQDRVQTFFQQAGSTYSTTVGNINLSGSLPRLLSDDLPPFDITITMANESGDVARMVITGVEIVDWGNAMGIDDMFIEETMSYMAQDIIPLHPDTLNGLPQVS